MTDDRILLCFHVGCPLLYKEQICHLFSAFLLATLEVERIKYYNLVCVNNNCSIYGSKVLFKDLFQEKMGLNQGKTTWNVSALLIEYPERASIQIKNVQD